MLQRTGTTVALAAVFAATMLGIVLGVFVDESYTIPGIATCMVIWAVVGKSLGGWRAVIIGLTALVAAFAGAIDALVLALWWAALASIAIIFPDYSKNITNNSEEGHFQ